MKRIKDIKRKPEIEYPCRWIYKVIGSDPGRLKYLIGMVLQDCDHAITLSSSSRTGKYHCYNVEVLVDCEEKRIAIYETLRKDANVKIVL